MNRERVRKHAAVATMAAAALSGSVLRERVVAMRFGASSAVDAYLLAFALVGYAIQVLGGSFGVALVPHLSRDGSREFIRAVVGRVVLLGAGAAALIWFLRSSIAQAAASGGSSLLEEQTTVAVGIVCLAVPLSMVNSTLTAALQVGRREVAASASPALRHFAFLAVVYFAVAGEAVALLAVAAVLSFGMETIYLGAQAWRAGLPLMPNFRGSVSMGELIGDSGWLAVNGALMGSTVVVDQLMAASHGEGAISSIGYAGKPPAAFLMIVATGIGAVLLPALSTMAATREFRGLRETTRRYSGWLLIGSVLIAALGIAASPLILDTLYGSGTFSAEHRLDMIACQRGYWAQSGGYVVVVVCTRGLLALRCLRTLFVVAVSIVATNLCGNYALGAMMGVAGIAWSTAVVYSVAGIGTAIALDRRLALSIAEPGDRPEDEQ